MAVENHPKYREWVDALDFLKASNDSYQEMVSSGTDAEITAARGVLNYAKAQYAKVSDEIDNA